MPTATVTSKGQVTIPKSVRDRLGVTAGDRVTFARQEDGSYVLRAERLDVLSLRGMVPYDGPAISVREMNDAIESEAGG